VWVTVQGPTEANPGGTIAEGLHRVEGGVLKVTDLQGRLVGMQSISPGDDVEVAARRILCEKRASAFYDPIQYPRRSMPKKGAALTGLMTPSVAVSDLVADEVVIVRCLLDPLSLCQYDHALALFELRPAGNIEADDLGAAEDDALIACPKTARGEHALACILCRDVEFT
jgi:hypothetical protein